MSFVEVVDEVARLLRDKKRISYRALKREFNLDDEALQDLKEELVHAKRVAQDEDGKVLIWAESPFNADSEDDAPVEGGTPFPLSHPERDRADPGGCGSHGASDGERKTITALFADLKGSTALIRSLDPEDARAIIDPILQLMMDAVHRYDGYVAQILGDGIFALFGAPIAHEDHPQRALHAALAMQQEIRRYSRQSGFEGCSALQIRVGVNTGEVVVRSMRKDDRHTDYIPVGYSTNLAARLEQKAAPGSIVISECTRKLTEGYFDLKDLGPVEIDGIAEAQNIYEVVGPGPLRTRLQFVARRGLTRFVGRKSELSRMRRALAQAKIGQGQIVGVVGEPGLGKSRLFHEFKLSSPPGCLVLEACSVSHGKAFPFLPLIEMLNDYFQLERSDGEGTRREKITCKILNLDKSFEEIVPYILWMMGVETAASSLRQMDPHIRKRRKFEALKRLLLRESLNQPLVLVLEDVHWLDHGTQSFLDTLSEALNPANILLLINFRPEYRHSWGNATSYSQIRLSPLDKAELEEFLTCLLGTDKSLVPLKKILLDKTEGTPFFLEEVVQAFVEEGVLIGEHGHYRLEATSLELHIPATVQGVLAARIDRLQSDEKELLQQLSVIGRHFPLNLVKRVIAQPENKLQQILSSLQAKEFLYGQTGLPEPRYRFKHALTHELAYSTVLHKQRKVLHEKTARALESLYSERLNEHYGELAHHYSRSPDTEKAVMYLGLAGQQAAQRSAYLDAINFLNQVNALLENQPDSPERRQQKVSFQITLAASIGAAKGYGSVEFERALSTAQTLCTHAEQAPQLSPLLYALRKMYMARGDLRKADELADHHLRLAERLESPSVRLLAHLGRGMISSSLGDFLEAHTHLENALRLYDIRDHHALASLYGDDPGPLSYCYDALVLWALGYPDQALAQSRESIRLAERLAHPLSTAWSELFASMLHQFRRESGVTLERAKAVQAVSQEHGLPLFFAGAKITQGWACTEQDDTEAGIASIQEGLTLYQAAGAKLWRPYFLALLANAYRKIANPEQGMRFIAEALVEAHNHHERQQEAELFRIQGELRLATACRKSDTNRTDSIASRLNAADLEKAEQDFQKALDIARRQSAKSWELRAAMSLARFWNEQGRSKEGLNLLYPIYEWFTEGFDTADLKAARALLDELETG